MKARRARRQKTHAALDDLDPGFCHWLAGFSDGEGCFYIHEGRGSHRCHFRIKLRSDDRPILEEIVTKTGIGYVVAVKSEYPQVEWLVVSKPDTIALVSIFDRFPLRAKKSRDYAICRDAVFTLADVTHIRRVGFRSGTVRHPNQLRLAELKKQLELIRKRP